MPAKPSVVKGGRRDADHPYPPWATSPDPRQPCVAAGVRPAQSRDPITLCASPGRKPQKTSALSALSVQSVSSPRVDRAVASTSISPRMPRVQAGAAAAGLAAMVSGAGEHPAQVVVAVGHDRARLGARHAVCHQASRLTVIRPAERVERAPAAVGRIVNDDEVAPAGSATGARGLRVV